MSDPAITAFRSAMPVTERYVYLNHAHISPLPRPTVEALGALGQRVAETGDLHWREREDRVEEVRGLIRRLIGAESLDEVAFVQNTSDALSVVSAGLDWRAGDNVVGASVEYPSNVYPWMGLEASGVEYRQVEEQGGVIDPDAVVAQLDERTRVLALSWIQYASGYRSDLARLGKVCRERGILFVVDAIQGLGALELDVVSDSIDVLAGGSHKWLLGPEGQGLLYVSNRVVSQLAPARLGWRSVADIDDWGKFDLTLGRGARRFECGTLNVYAIDALGVSIALLDRVGADAEARVLALARRAARGLAERGFELVGKTVESGIVAASHPTLDIGALVHQLAERRVIVAERLGRLRVSPHVYNTEDEIDTFLGEIDRAQQ